MGERGARAGAPMLDASGAVGGGDARAHHTSHLMDSAFEAPQQPSLAERFTGAFMTWVRAAPPHHAGPPHPRHNRRLRRSSHVVKASDGGGGVEPRWFSTNARPRRCRPSHPPPPPLPQCGVGAVLAQRRLGGGAQMQKGTALQENHRGGAATPLVRGGRA